MEVCLYAQRINHNIMSSSDLDNPRLFGWIATQEERRIASRDRHNDVTSIQVDCSFGVKSGNSAFKG
jgi:hypothetical protein